MTDKTITPSPLLVVGLDRKVRHIFNKERKLSMMNRKANCHNKYQGTAKRVLCVCSAGLLRSPTAAFVLQKEFGFNTRAAGLTAEFALIPVDEVLLEWADEVVVMEQWMYEQLKDFDGTLICLNVPDSFERMDEKLQKIILEKYMAQTEGA